MISTEKLEFVCKSEYFWLFKYRKFEKSEEEKIRKKSDLKYLTKKSVSTY